MKAKIVGISKILITADKLMLECLTDGRGKFTLLLEDNGDKTAVINSFTKEFVDKIIRYLNETEI